MAVSGLNHYNITAPAALLQEVRDFYCDVLGLEQGVKPPPVNGGFWLFAGTSPVLHLSVDEDACRFTTSTTIDHIAFTCSDFDATCAKLDAASVKYAASAAANGRPGQIFLNDVVGNGVELNFR